MRTPKASLFVYGTLKDASTVARLLGRVPPAEAAQVRGYRRMTPSGSYPYITPAPGHVVHGMLLRGLDAAALAVLDQYEAEGTLYRRAVVDVVVATGNEQAFTYVGIPAAHRAPRAS